MSTPVIIYQAPENQWPAIMEALTESIHQSLDGWTETEAIVIRAYIEDLELAATVILESGK